MRVFVMINNVYFEGENMFVQFNGVLVSHLAHGFVKIADETGFIGTYTADSGAKLASFPIGAKVLVTVGNYPRLLGGRNTFQSVDVTLK